MMDFFITAQCWGAPSLYPTYVAMCIFYPSLLSFHAGFRRDFVRNSAHSSLSHIFPKNPALMFSFFV